MVTCDRNLSQYSICLAMANLSGYKCIQANLGFVVVTNKSSQSISGKCMSQGIVTYKSRHCVTVVLLLKMSNHSQHLLSNKRMVRKICIHEDYFARFLYYIHLNLKLSIYAYGVATHYYSIEIVKM